MAAPSDAHAVMQTVAPPEYEAVAKTSDEKGPFDSKVSPVPTSTPPPSRRRWARRALRHAWLNATIAISSTALLFMLIPWIISSSSQWSRFNFLTGRAVGGQFTQMQAKAIDFICSALISPALMLVLDYAWFSSAQVSAINERQTTQGIPLQSLVAASETDCGTYDMIQFWHLMRAKTWRFLFLAILALLSAITRTSVSNIVAYEAYDDLVPSNGTLRYMRDVDVDGANMHGDPPESLHAYNYSPSQQSFAANAISSMLTRITLTGNKTLDRGGGYVGVNATMCSMNNLPQSMLEIHNIPGWRLTIDCTPSQPDSFYAVPYDDYDVQLRGLWFNRNSTSDLPEVADWFAGNLPGVIGSIQEQNNEYFPYVLFDKNSTDFYIGDATGSDRRHDVYPTKFGPIQPRAWNASTLGLNLDIGVMSTWGLRCSLARQQGLLSYNRTPGQAWTITKKDFSGPKTPAYSRLFDWQLNLNFHAPGRKEPMPGIGPAFKRTAGEVPCTAAQWAMGGNASTCVDFSTWVSNFLYASGEAERIMYEVAATNSTIVLPQYFYTAATSQSVQQYRITYIPLILLFGLVSMLFAAVITGSMAFYTRNTLTSLLSRQVSTLRLVVDSVAGLSGDADLIETVGRLSHRRLERWASAYKVKYAVVGDGSGDGEDVVRLFKAKAAGADEKEQKC
ncbi:uncharacterized protein J3D65DRAFT_631305 [Phyllosticta citribraziliensis]|uniref:Uncharacterized protein n=1 Tax=Phyllosticta citribraziliensis TaxID=989973 RepID=A0ABR1LGG0_9PEZI